MNDIAWSSAVAVGSVVARKLAGCIERLAGVYRDSRTLAVMLGFRAGQDMVLVANDRDSLVCDVVPMLCASPIDLNASVSPAIAKLIHQTFQPDDELELRILQRGSSGQVLIRTRHGAAATQECFSSEAQFEAYQMITQGEVATTAWVASEDVTNLLNATFEDDELTLVLAPGKLIARNANGMLTAPTPSSLTGVPARVEVSVPSLRMGWMFARKIGSTWLPLTAFEVRQGGAVLKVYCADRAASCDQLVFGTADVYIYTIPTPAAGLPKAELPDPNRAALPVAAPSADPPSPGAVPDRGDEVEAILAELDAITGQPQLKAEIRRLLGQVRVNKEKQARGLKASQVGMHMIFAGPPGTGKTTVARLVARLLHALDILPDDQLVEVDKACLVAAHVGGTEEKTTEVIERSLGGVLFIDEAYALANDQFGRQAIEVLLKALEDHREHFVCIAAGYSEEMKAFVDSNPGVRSRFARTITFQPYSVEELIEIGIRMANADDNVFDEGALATLRIRVGDEERRGGLADKRWGNARSIRNIVDTAVAARDLRIADAGLFDEESITTITEFDVVKACDDLRVGRAVSGVESVEEVLTELDRQVGQAQLKQQVKVLIAGAKAAQLRAAQGLTTAPDLPHLVFTGPPGTGKTTVARLIARLYRALGLLAEGQLVEVDRSKLVASHIGGTGEKTSKAIDEAMGGVLFIDEAYALVNGEDAFGQEAVDTLLKRLSDDQGRFVAIVAGYPQQMEQFLQANPGLTRRFATKIEFASYTASELAEIAELMAADRGEHLDDEARSQLRSRLERAESSGGFSRTDWGNAGSVGNIVALAARLRNTRLLTGSAAEPSPESLATITAQDMAEACDSVLGNKGQTQESVEDVLAELNRQVGQDQLKRQVQMLLADARAAKLRREGGLEAGRPDLPHLLFTGPPGTGKTTIARLLARLYKALGVLPQGQVIEVDRGGLVEGYVGQTATKTTKVVDSALGGILFIDEAYTLTRGGDAFGQEALDTLLKRMTDNQGAFLVIAAGYPDQMEQFLQTNPGLRRRFATTIEFAPYTGDELARIGALMATDRHERLGEQARSVLAGRLRAAERAGLFGATDWGNAGSVSNLIAEAIRHRNLGLSSSPDPDELTTLTVADITAACDKVLGANGEVGTGEPVLARLETHLEQPRRAHGLAAGAPAPWTPRPAQPEVGVGAEVAALVGAVVDKLAPGALPGQPVPAGPELAALGVTEVYWQRSRSGGGGGMGVQLRLVPGSKDRMYYFAGGSNGQLPAIFTAGGAAVLPENERDLSGRVFPRTLAEWKRQPTPADRLSNMILDVIAADRGRTASNELRQ